MDRHQQPVAWQAVSQTRDEWSQQARGQRPRQACEANRVIHIGWQAGRDFGDARVAGSAVEV